MQQSLLPAIYPMLKTILQSRFRPDRPDHADLPAHRLAAAAAGRAVHRPPPAALFAGRRHGPDAGGSADPVAGRQLSRRCWLGAALVGTGSSVFHPESSRMARLASGGRHGLAQSLFQLGGNFGTAAGPLLAAFIVLPRGPGQPRLVLAGGADGHRRAVPGRRLVPPPPPRRKPRIPRRAAPSRRRHRRPVVVRGIAVLAALMFSKSFLYRQPRHVLHLLPDPPLRRAGADGAALSVHLSRRLGGGHPGRRSGGRPVRPALCHLAFHPRPAAVHPAAAACRTCSGRSR